MLRAVSPFATAHTFCLKVFCKQEKKILARASEIQSKAPVSQLVNEELNSGNHIKQCLHQTRLQLRIRERHAGMKCAQKGIKHCSHRVWLAQDSNCKSYSTRKL